jgi:hypothetical protein
MDHQMSKAHIHYFATGSWPVYFGFTTKKKEYDKEVKRIKVKEPRPWVTPGSNATTHVLLRYDHVTIIVCLKRKKGISKSQLAALLAHEAAHVWNEVCDAMKGECPKGEHQAYGIQWIVQQMAANMKEFK